MTVAKKSAGKKPSVKKSTTKRTAAKKTAAKKTITKKPLKKAVKKTTVSSKSAVEKVVRKSVESTPGALDIRNRLSLMVLSSYRFPIDPERLAIQSARLAGVAFVFMGAFLAVVNVPLASDEMASLVSSEPQFASLMTASEVESRQLTNVPSNYYSASVEQNSNSQSGVNSVQSLLNDNFILLLLSVLVILLGLLLITLGMHLKSKNTTVSIDDSSDE